MSRGVYRRVCWLVTQLLYMLFLHLRLFSCTGRSDSPKNFKVRHLFRVQTMQLWDDHLFLQQKHFGRKSLRKRPSLLWITFSLIYFSLADWDTTLCFTRLETDSIQPESALKNGVKLAKKFGIGLESYESPPKRFYDQRIKHFQEVLLSVNKTSLAFS